MIKIFLGLFVIVFLVNGRLIKFYISEGIIFNKLNGKRMNNNVIVLIFWNSV